VQLLLQLVAATITARLHRAIAALSLVYIQRNAMKTKKTQSKNRQTPLLVIAIPRLNSQSGDPGWRNL